jgi:superfamily I DNA and/or RNA helicase
MNMRNELLMCLKFDYCIVVEAAYINEPLTLGPLSISDKFIMIGDYLAEKPYCASEMVC